MNLKKLAPVVLSLTALSLQPTPAQPAVPATQNVTTYMYDLYQSGVNPNETILTSPK